MLDFGWAEVVLIALFVGPIIVIGIYTAPLWNGTTGPK
jgi:hypothetical protein